MAAQDVRVIVPRVRRAVEGPAGIPSGPDALTDDQALALAADCIADIILLTEGRWEHTLAVAGTDQNTGLPSEWSVDPELTLPEQSVVAAQAAITYFFHQVRDLKTSETLTNEGQTWTYEISGALLRDQIKLLQQQRDAAIAALLSSHPVLARYASILEVRDRVGAAILEPFQGHGGFPSLGLGGGMERGGNVWHLAP
jgi:hypothetical protein